LRSLTETSVIERHENQNRYDETGPAITLIHDRGVFGLLKIELPGATIRVRLHQRHLKILVFLNGALVEDENLDEEFRGLRRNAEIAESYAKSDRFAYIPGPKAIGAYRSQIHRLIRDATPEGFTPLRLMQSVRGAGVRLIHKIDVIDLSARNT